MKTKDILNNIISSFNPLRRFSPTNNNELVPISLLVVDARNKILSMKLSDINFTPADQNNTVKVLSYSYIIDGDSLRRSPINIINTYPPFSIEATENLIFTITSKQLDSSGNSIKILEKYILKVGKGTYGLGGTQLVNTDIELIYKNILTVDDIDPSSTVTYLIPTLVGQTLVDYINNGLTTYVVQPVENGETLFIVGDEPDTSFYLFVGTPGSYGFSANSVVDSDFSLLPKSSSIPSLDAVTQIGNTSKRPIIVQNTSGTFLTLLADRALRFFNNNFFMTFDTKGLTNNRRISLPDKSGVVALEEDIPNFSPFSVYHPTRYNYIGNNVFPIPSDLIVTSVTYNGGGETTNWIESGDTIIFNENPMSPGDYLIISGFRNNILIGSDIPTLTQVTNEGSVSLVTIQSPDAVNANDLVNLGQVEQLISEIDIPIAFTIDASLYLDLITNELRANTGLSTENFEYTSGLQEFTLVDEPSFVFSLMLNLVEINNPLTDYSIDGKKLTILKPIEPTDKINITYQFIITT